MFIINSKDKIQIKGIINSTNLKVSFLDEMWENKKIKFEEFINNIL